MFFNDFKNFWTAPARYWPSPQLIIIKNKFPINSHIACSHIACSIQAKFAKYRDQLNFFQTVLANSLELFKNKKLTLAECQKLAQDTFDKMRQRKIRDGKLHGPANKGGSKLLDFQVLVY